MSAKPLSEHTRRNILETGDPALWAPLFRWYQYRLVRFIEGLGADHHEAEDLAQNTFIKAVNNFHKFNRTCDSFAPWLFAIARNEFRSHVRKTPRAERAPGTTTWLERQQDVVEDDVQLSDLEPTVDDRERALQSAVAHPDFPGGDEIVGKELFAQLAFLDEQRESAVVERTMFQLITRLDQVAERRFLNAEEVRSTTPRRNWEVFLLRHMLSMPAKLCARLLGLEYSANIHKMGYRVKERLRDTS
ncbi:MAG: sigma-70 family RNA polymerase sigma factor [Pirellulaceae bacterium]|jgi:RNA polymerase sigma factor (sigma-70 family)|nr:sigma-70 family RNA polymerase sigma factor [Pirellulaceae bacterium]MDP7015494.1 sigma-70 family RNA polymerase sigma factor [Pirellulaceae bacterium]